MDTITSLHDLVPVTPSAAARTGAHCLVPDRGSTSFPAWVHAWDERGELVALVHVQDPSEAFVVIAKLLTILPPWGSPGGRHTRLVVADEPIAARTLVAAGD